MKKITLFTFLFLTGMTLAFAQNPIPNPSFENWRGYPIVNGVPCSACTGTQPDGWTTSDSSGMLALCGGNHNAVQELVDKCGGNYSIKLTTWTCPILSATILGTATNGKISIGAGIVVSGGSFDNIRHDKFTGCYKYTPAGSDTAIISAYLFRWNGTARETLAVAMMKPSAATGSMTPFTIPFAYQSTATPDTILVICGSSLGVNGSAAAGSTLIIDTLGVSGIASLVEENSVIKNIKVYPQPTTGDLLNLDVTFGHYIKSTYSLIDAVGRMVMTSDLQEKQQINIASLANGIYTLTLNDASGEKLYTTRVTVRR